MLGRRFFERVKVNSTEGHTLAFWLRCVLLHQGQGRDLPLLYVIIMDLMMRNRIYVNFEILPSAIIVILILIKVIADCWKLPV